MQEQLLTNQTAARPSGRCIGAMFFSAFGAVWLLSSCIFFKRFTPWTICAILLTAAFLFFTANHLKRKLSSFESGPPDRQKQRDDRAFGLLNALTYIAVFLLFLTFPKIGLENYIFPAFVGLIGLHFFPMPPSYRHRSNLVTGSILIIWAVTCAVAFHANGDRIAAFACLGAGLTLWVSAVWALIVANRTYELMPRSN